MSIQRDQAYYAAKMADDAWCDALVAKYGKRAAQVRYTHLGKEGDFASLYAAYQAACKALREVPT
jgi:hypothetical protein